MVAVGGGDLCILEGASKGRGGLYPRDAEYTRKGAEKARGRVPLQRRRNPVPCLVCWRRLCDNILARRLGSGPRSVEGALLVEASTQPGTASKYVNNWEAFSSFCSSASL